MNTLGDNNDNAGGGSHHDYDLGLLGKIVGGILSFIQQKNATTTATTTAGYGEYNGEDRVAAASAPAIQCYVSIVEIADDDVLRDVLLSSEGEGFDEHGGTERLLVRHLDKRGAVVLNLSEVAISSMEELHRLLQESFQSKSLSRMWSNEGGHGHFVATITVVDGSRGDDCASTIQLVDLASPDRPATNATASRSVVSVRKSLSALRGVLRGVLKTTQQQQPANKNGDATVPTRSSFTSPIPYRESTLTKLLQRSLEADQGGGNGGGVAPHLCRTVVIGVVMPDSKNYNQTLGTINFMTRLLSKPGETAMSPFENTLLTRSYSGDNARKLSVEVQQQSQLQSASLSPYRKSSIASHPPALKSITSDPRQRLAKLLHTGPKDNPSKNTVHSTSKKGTVDNTTQDAANTPERSDQNYDNVFDQLDVLMSVDEDDSAVDRNSYGDDIIHALTPYNKAGRGARGGDGESSNDSSEGMMTPSPFRERGTRKAVMPSGGDSVDSSKGPTHGPFSTLRRNNQADDDGDVTTAKRRELERKQEEDKKRLRDLFLGVRGHDDESAANDPLCQSLFPSSPEPLHTEIEFHQPLIPDDSGNDWDTATSLRLDDENDFDRSHHQQPVTQSNFQTEQTERHQDLASDATMDPNNEAGQSHDRAKDGFHENRAASADANSDVRSKPADDNDHISKGDDVMIRRHLRGKQEQTGVNSQHGGHYRSVEIKGAGSNGQPAFYENHFGNADADVRSNNADDPMLRRRLRRQQEQIQQQGQPRLQEDHGVECENDSLGARLPTQKADVEDNFFAMKQGRNYQEGQAQLRENHHSAEFNDNGANRNPVDDGPPLHTGINFHRHSKPNDFGDNFSISSSTLGNKIGSDESHHQHTTQTNFLSQPTVADQLVDSTQDHKYEASQNHRGWNGKSSSDSPEGLPASYIGEADDVINEAANFMRLQQGRNHEEDQSQLREEHHSVECEDADARPPLHTDIEFHRPAKFDNGDNYSISSSTLGKISDSHGSHLQPTTQSHLHTEQIKPHLLLSSTHDQSHVRDTIQVPNLNPKPHQYEAGQSHDRQAGGSLTDSIERPPTFYKDNIDEADNDRSNNADTFTRGQQTRKQQGDLSRLREDSQSEDTRSHTQSVDAGPLLQTEIESRSKPGKSGSWNTAASRLSNENNSKGSHQQQPAAQSNFKREPIDFHPFANATQQDQNHGTKVIRAPNLDPKPRPHGVEPSQGSSIPLPVGIFDENRVVRSSDIMFGQQERLRQGHNDGNDSSSILGNNNDDEESYRHHPPPPFSQIQETSTHAVTNFVENKSAITSGVPKSSDQRPGLADTRGDSLDKKSQICARNESPSLGTDHSGGNEGPKDNASAFVQKSSVAPLTVLLSRDSMDSEPLVTSRATEHFFTDSPKIDDPPNTVDVPKSPTFTMLESFTEEIDALVNNLTSPPSAVKKTGSIPMTNVPEVSSQSTDGYAMHDLQNGSAFIEESVDPKINILEDELASLKAKVHSLVQEKTISEAFVQKMQLVMNENDDEEVLIDAPSSWPQPYKAFEESIRERQSLLSTLQAQLEVSQAESIESARELQRAESRVAELSQSVDHTWSSLVDTRKEIDSQTKTSESEINCLKEQLKNLNTKNMASTVFFRQLDPLIGINHVEASIHEENQCKIRLDIIGSLRTKLKEGLEKLEESVEREVLAKNAVGELTSKVHKLEHQTIQIQESSVRMEKKRLETEKIAEEAISANEALTDEVAALQGKSLTIQNEHRTLLDSHNSALGVNKKLSVEFVKTKSLLAERGHEISTLKKSFGTCREEKMELEHQLASIRTKTVDVMKQRIEALKADYTKRFEDYKTNYSLEQEREGMSRLKLDLSNKESENAKLRKRIEQIEKSTSLKLQNAEERLLKVRGELKSASDEAYNLKEEKKEMQIELDNMRSLMDIAEESVGELKLLKQENEKLNDSLKLQYEQDSHDNVGNQFTNDMEDDYFVHERISALMRENEQNNISMKTLRGENVTLKSSIEECTSTIHLMHSEMNDLKTIATDGVSKLRSREKSLLEQQRSDRDALAEMEKKLENATNLVQSLRSGGVEMFSNPYVPPPSISTYQTPQRDRGAYQPMSELRSRGIDYRATPSRVPFNDKRAAAQLTAEKELRYKAEEICAGVLANSKSALEERDSEIGKLRSQLFNLTRGR